MSYEGYDIYYCANGHEVETVGCYESFETVICPICGSTEFYRDAVDETNGCYCDEILEEGERCPAHPSVTKVIAFTLIDCPYCKGTKTVSMPSTYKDEPCECASTGCEVCFNTKVKRVPDNEITVQCPTCKGRGFTGEPVYDIQVLIDKYNKK